MSDLFDSNAAQKESERTARIQELVSLIKKYQQSYYDGEGEISDAEFDKLWDELKSLDPQNTVLQKVGADSGNFAKVRHIMPMGSLEKAADPEQFSSWALNHAYSEYLVEYKLDGASLELQYEHGTLVRAVTRGDGTIGDDITVNAKKMHGVQPALFSKDGNRTDYTGGVRGEVLMFHKVHDTLYADKANCRNAANGLMKRKDGSGSENLMLITYDAWEQNGNNPFKDEEEKIAWLNACGFTTAPLKICESVQEVIDYRAEVMEKRSTLDYDIDGLVVKERTINHGDASRARPERQIAFKFSLEEAVTVVHEVEWSEAGATYTPVALFDPVQLAGTTVQRASLANPGTIRALGLQIGSRVVVVKRGEIIPKIESVLAEDRILSAQSECDRQIGRTESRKRDSAESAFVRTIPFSPVIVPSSCSSCGTKLVDEGTRLYCPNKKCPKRILHQLQKWISVADIRDLGDTLIRALFNSGRVMSISDIYSLKADELVPYFLNEESIAAQKDSLGAQKVADSINAHRSMSLAVFVAGFDIEGIGETTVQKLVDAGYNTLQKLFDATEDQFAAVYGFAEIMAHTAVQGLAENREEMTALVSSHTLHVSEGSALGTLAGKSFCFTGELVTMKRADAEQLVKKAGGSCKSSVTKDLSYLVTNDTSSGSSKNAKAAQLGIPVITELQFQDLVK